MREGRLYPKISELFEEDYFVFYKYRIPDNSRREIDILCLKKYEYPELIAIEVKIRDWKRALKQSFKRLFYVDKCYIALSKEYVERVDVSKVSKYGIGLISVDGCAKIVLEAEKSNRVLNWRKEMLLKDLMIKIGCGEDIL